MVDDNDNNIWWKHTHTPPTAVNNEPSMSLGVKPFCSGCLADFAIRARRR